MNSELQQASSLLNDLKNVFNQQQPQIPQSQQILGKLKAKNQL